MCVHSIITDWLVLNSLHTEESEGHAAGTGEDSDHQWSSSLGLDLWGRVE
jgi:hypothetical protein